jgi:hypothetical protein
MHAADVIDLERYPIDRLDSPEGLRLLEETRAALRAEGACQLHGFLRPQAVERLVAEALSKRELAYRTDDTHNVYFETSPDGLPDDDPRALLQRSAKRAVAWDLPRLTGSRSGVIELENDPGTLSLFRGHHSMLGSPRSREARSGSTPCSPMPRSRAAGSTS